MIEEITSDILAKLNITPSKDIQEFVGVENHISNMSSLLQLEKEEVRMVGIWGPSGIGKTTIARILYNSISRQFQGSIFLDRAFISKSKENYHGANSDDYNMKLSLQQNFLSQILGIKIKKIDHLGVVKERLNHMKVLIIIDDLDDHMVLNALVNETQWFGPWSRIIVITNDKHFLMAHHIGHIYEMYLPSKEVALQIFCKSAFGNIFPPEGFKKLASEVAERAGSLPLGLNLLGSHLRGRDNDYWRNSLPRLRKTLNGKIESTLRVSYDGLETEEDQAIFRHIACFLNGAGINYIKLLLEKSGLNIKCGLQNLIDKSFLHVNVKSDTVEMHHLLQEMGKEIVHAQSKEPGEREFLMDSEDTCDVLSDNTGTITVLGITLDIDEIDDLYVHQEAFKGMRNLRYLNIFTKQLLLEKEDSLHLPDKFEYLSSKLRLLCWDRYPSRIMPSKFRPGNLVELKMRGSKLEELWKGIEPLMCLRTITLENSKNLKELPDLSKATNLKSLNLDGCSSLKELPTSIENLNELTSLTMQNCTNLETFPTGINLQSLRLLHLVGCTRLTSFPIISTNLVYLIINEIAIENIPSTNLPLKNLTEFCMYGTENGKLWDIEKPMRRMMMMLPSTLKILRFINIPSLVTIPGPVDFNYLTDLTINCKNLETLPSNMSSSDLIFIDLSGCSRLTTFPDVFEVSQIEALYLDETAIEEVPWWIEKFESLDSLKMSKCKKLKYVSPNIFKLEDLCDINFSDCGALTTVNWHEHMYAVAMKAYNTHSKLPVAEEVSSSLLNNCAKLEFINCFNTDQEVLLQSLSVFKQLILPVGEVPAYFTHQANGDSLANIPLLQTSYSQKNLKFRACVLVDTESNPTAFVHTTIRPDCTPHRFINRNGSGPIFGPPLFIIPKIESLVLIIFDCIIYIKEDYDHLDIRFDAEGSKIKRCGMRYCGENSDWVVSKKPTARKLRQDMYVKIVLGLI